MFIPDFPVYFTSARFQGAYCSTLRYSWTAEVVSDEGEVVDAEVEENARMVNEFLAGVELPDFTLPSEMVRRYSYAYHSHHCHA